MRTAPHTWAGRRRSSGVLSCVARARVALVSATQFGSGPMANDTFTYLESLHNEDQPVDVLSRFENPQALAFTSMVFYHNDKGPIDEEEVTKLLVHYGDVWHCMGWSNGLHATGAPIMFELLLVNEGTSIYLKKEGPLSVTIHGNVKCDGLKKVPPKKGPGAPGPSDGLKKDAATGKGRPASHENSKSAIAPARQLFRENSPESDVAVAPAKPPSDGLFLANQDDFDEVMEATDPVTPAPVSTPVHVPKSPFPAPNPLANVTEWKTFYQKMHGQITTHLSSSGELNDTTLQNLVQKGLTKCIKFFNSVDFSQKANQKESGQFQERFLAAFAEKNLNKQAADPSAPPSAAGSKTSHKKRPKAE